jgi:hypothetical protein
MQGILWMSVNEMSNRIFGSKVENVRGIRRNLKLTICPLRPMLGVSVSKSRVQIGRTYSMHRVNVAGRRLLERQKRVCDDCSESDYKESESKVVLIRLAENRV